MSSHEPELSAHSASEDAVDVVSSPQSLARAVYDRRSEYVRPHRIRVKIGTWNVAACPGTDKDLASWFVDGKGVDQHLASADMANNPVVEDSQATNSGISSTDHDDVRVMGGDKIGLYVLGLQEIVDLNSVTRMTYTDSAPMAKWKAALEEAMPVGYQIVASEQMSGLVLLVCASPEIAPTISNVSTTQVGTGLFGYLGNKGAVATRLLLGETTRLCFVNCHLASGPDQANLERRTWDYNQILSRTTFDPINIAGMPDGRSENIGDEDFAFWLGDLNFRLDGLPGPDIRHLLMLHTRGEYDLTKKTKFLGGEEVFVVKSEDDDDDSSTMASTLSRSDSFDESTSSLPDPDDFLPDPHDDPGSLQATLDSLLPHDQLGRMIKEKKAFHQGWREGPITFLPSYKYDVGTISLFDSSEKQRAPSWCDRILYRTRRDKEEHDRKVKESEEARKKDNLMKAQGLEEAADDDDVLFSYDPDADAEPEEQSKPTSTSAAYDEYDEEEDDNETVEVITKEGFRDQIRLDLYASHQRITSSDHKPIMSIFTLDYDAVAPELKAKVHAEVARELDRAENEGRPLITIVIDTEHESSGESSGRPADQGEPVDFGDVLFMKEQTMSLTIANNGRVPAKFAFVEKPSADVNGARDPPHWLSTYFRRLDGDFDRNELPHLGRDVTLEPGETINAMLEVLVQDISQVSALNTGRATLEDVLVLRVEEGRDHFIPIRGNWLPTCFGRSLEELIRVPDGGIRAFAQSKSVNGGSISYDLDVQTAAPKELFKITELLESLTTRVLADEAMLEQLIVPADKPGWPFDSSTWLFKDKATRDDQVASLVEALDTDQPLAQTLPLDSPALHRLEVVSEVLVLFLRSLSDGIVPAGLWAKLENAFPGTGPSLAASRPQNEIEDDKAAVLDILAAAPNHNISFVFLTSTLSKVTAELSPPTKGEVQSLLNSSSNKRISAIGRNLRRMTNGGGDRAAAQAALARRHARERKFAEILGPIVCRAGLSFKDKERKATEERMRAVVELFVRKPMEHS